jgi:flagellar protein FliS
MRDYQQAAVESASSVQLVVALYDGLQRFLLQASAACEVGDAEARRLSARKAANIVIHLQTCLRLDIGGQPAASLSDFYTAVLADILRASASNSSRQFLETAREVRNVRDAWQAAAADPAVSSFVPRDLQTWEEQAAQPLPSGHRRATTPALPG